MKVVAINICRCRRQDMLERLIRQGNRAEKILKKKEKGKKILNLKKKGQQTEKYKGPGSKWTEIQDSLTDRFAAMEARMDRHDHEVAMAMNSLDKKVGAVLDQLAINAGGTGNQSETFFGICSSAS